MSISLKTPLQFLKGVGPERSKTLARLGLMTIGDAFYYFPRRYENRFPIKRITQITAGEKECVLGTVQSRGLIRTRYGQTLFKVVLQDELEASVLSSSLLFGVWYNQPYLGKVFLPKSKVVFYGTVEKEGRHFQMIHPEYELLSADEPKETIHSGRIVPIYPLTEDLSQKGLRQLIFRVVSEYARLVKDPLPVSIRRRLGLRNLVSAVREIHFPSTEAARLNAYERLVFNEFLLLQLVIQMKKMELQKENKLVSHRTGEEKVSEFMRSLGFQLTPGQQNAVQDIMNDMKKNRSMNRLVQGDVGSGKTAVAAAGLVFTVANGFQGVLMAPTEVLAQQHYFNLTQALEPLGITCGYLANELSTESKQKVLNDLASGTLQIVIGTHALIQGPVRFKNLGLVVIDEQHKFGVFQRAALKDKAKNQPHFLLMTATPIPRTLAFTLYGDLDISVMSELPKGRKPIKTLWVGDNRRSEIYRFLDSQVEKGGQGYVICPLIETRYNSQSEDQSDKRAGALEVYQKLCKIFSHRKVGLLHGRMKGPEKKRVMQAFKDRKIDILVSTVVIEVGVDIPNANIMIIEDAERFGLSQLHQLRGRVGRGTEESTCVLFSDTTNAETMERLSSFESTQSGFEIAEKDLDLRGAGEIIGEKQHGFPNLRIGDLLKDLPVLIKAKNEAVRILEKDTRLESTENRALKMAMRERFGLRDEKKLAVYA
ncbi:MAG: ATP-dependent DNA helicase RecG [Candidatus Omnitrophica bacterium CG1_02_46_14]|nr:MAG: ATP-dependent DNA helicase RecG [Candidatus Omnitrophica bacterium CG1_02_46_14]